MAKTLNFTYGDKDYTLEYTRATVKIMEEKGFVAADIESKPMSVLPALFEGAFLAHHRFEKKETVEKIYALLSNKQELIDKLAEMYNEPIKALLDEPDEGNVDWTASW